MPCVASQRTTSVIVYQSFTWYVDIARPAGPAFHTIEIVFKIDRGASCEVQFPFEVFLWLWLPVSHCPQLDLKSAKMLMVPLDINTIMVPLDIKNITVA